MKRIFTLFQVSFLLAAFTLISKISQAQTATINWGGATGLSTTSGSSLTGTKTGVVVGTKTVDISYSITFSGATPTFDDNGTGNVNRQVDVDFANTTSTVTLVLTFSKPVRIVTFPIDNVDYINNIAGTRNNDRLVITGINGNNTTNNILQFGANTYSGLNLTPAGNGPAGPGSPSLTAVGSNGFIFGGTDITIQTNSTLPGVSKLTIVYGSGAINGGTNPSAQSINLLPFIISDAGTSNAPLPLQLGGFSAQKGTGKVSLNWTTVLEVNTSHFEVEHSNNGSSWKTISVVAAKGNSNSAQKYAADDIANYSSKVYYRLKMVDIDGKFEYSPIAVVTFGGKGKIFAYPNPATSFTMVSSDKAITENVTVSIFNTTGVLVKQQVITNPGNNFRVGLEDLKQGTYLLKINQGAELLEVIKIQKN